MLPAVYEERFQKLMTSKNEDILRKLNEQYSKTSADAARRGFLNSTYIHGLFQRNRIECITERARAVVEIHQRLLPTLGVSYSDTLSEHLKAYVHKSLPESWCDRLLESKPPQGLQSNPMARFLGELRSARQKAIRDAEIEIDLTVDGIRIAQSKEAPVSTREVDQKFRILWSSSEAQKDFDRYKEELNGTNGEIAILFVDLDKFKDLNTKYTEPVIDKNFLPEAMRLIETLVRGRGFAYKQGGDEYVVLLPNYEVDEAMHFAEKIRKRFERLEVAIGSDVVRVTVSVGVGLWPNHGETYESVLIRASAAKQVAKQKRNCTKMATLDEVPIDSLSKLGLAPSTQRLARFLNERSQHAGSRDPILSPNEIRQQLQLSEEDLAIAADELRARSWAQLEPNGSKVGFSHISPAPALFFETDPLLKGWDPRRDAKALAAEALVEGGDTVSLQQLADKLGWEARRLNPAAWWLDHRQLAKLTTVMGSSPLRFSGMLVTPATRRFTSEK